MPGVGADEREIPVGDFGMMSLNEFFDLQGTYSSSYGVGHYKRGTTDLATVVLRVREGGHAHSVEVYGPRSIRASSPQEPPHPDRADGDRFLQLWNTVSDAVPRPGTGEAKR